MYKSLFAITLLASGSALKFDKDVMRAHGIVSYKQLRADVLASAGTRRLEMDDGGWDDGNDDLPTWICADDDCMDDGASLCPTGYSALSTCITEDTDCDNDDYRDDAYDANVVDDDDSWSYSYSICDSYFSSTEPYNTHVLLRNCATQSDIPSGCGCLTEYNDYMECAMEGFVLMLFDVTCDFSSTCGITYSATEEPITTDTVSAASRGSSAVGALALGAMALVSWFF